jgi:peptidoglycan/xylan/chitin deacetylase (PgdA/CDA1 family)
MLTFDLEEFDIPEEYGQKVPETEQMEVTLRGMERLTAVLDAHDIRATFFTTGHFADQNPELIRRLAARHEIASHALYHSPAHVFRETDILHSRRILEAISGQTVTGFRMPRLARFDKNILRKWGFRYDSSINPTWLPGRYNLLSESPLPSITDGLIELPCSVTPWLRFPLFWLSLKSLPASLYAWLCVLTLKKRKNLMLYFHPWEFADLGGYQLPAYVKNPDGDRLVSKLDQLIRTLKKQNTTFVTCSTYCDYWEQNKKPGL